MLKTVSKSISHIQNLLQSRTVLRRDKHIKWTFFKDKCSVLSAVWWTQNQYARKERVPCQNSLQTDFVNIITIHYFLSWNVNYTAASVSLIRLSTNDHISCDSFSTWVSAHCTLCSFNMILSLPSAQFTRACELRTDIIPVSITVRGIT